MKLDKSYKNFITDLKQQIYSAKSKAVLSANRLMIELYFDIGHKIVQNQEQQGWGKSVVEQMSKDLKDEFGEKSGYSASNLWRMRNFYLIYKDDEYLAQLVRDISWGQNILIFEKCKLKDEREYYIKKAVEYGWNRNTLTHHIKRNLFQRDDNLQKNNNFDITLKTEISELAQDIVKSEYNLEFLGISKDMNERKIEKTMVENIKKFLLELGYGFSFIDNQYRVVLGDNEYFIDLLFFHRKLNALIAIELKVGKFKPEYAGKMNFYLNILNDKVKMPHENPAIGIILCTDKDSIEVEYSLLNTSQAMGVATYNLKDTLPKELEDNLPTKEELQQQILGHKNEK